MATANMIYEWEGDATQALGSFTYKTREFIFPSRIRLSYARALFERGDLSDYWDLVEARNDVISRNKAKIAEGTIDGAGGRVGGGFWFAETAISSPDMETVPDAPVYAGDLTLTLKTYCDGTLSSTQTIYSYRPFRIGVNSRHTKWQFELIGNVDAVHRFDAASSIREIMQVQTEG